MALKDNKFTTPRPTAAGEVVGYIMLESIVYGLDYMVIEGLMGAYDSGRE